MTSHPHDQSRPSIASSRPRWLLPGTAIAVVLGALVLTGALSFSAAFTIVLFGGMMLMHLGGHGMHGGHVGGGSHAHDGEEAEARAVERTGAATADEATGDDRRTGDDRPTDARGGHGCH